MKNLWAPWRMEYILGAKKGGCFFCQSLREKNGSKNLILYRGEKCLVILNRFPYNNGHLMVAPFRHIGKLESLKEEELKEMFSLAQKLIPLLKETLNPQGFNLGINLGKVAGAGVRGHLHLHIVPRWEGDTNFMPVLSRTKVIPENLAETYRKLKEAIGRKLP